MEQTSSGRRLFRQYHLAGAHGNRGNRLQLRKPYPLRPLHSAISCHQAVGHIIERHGWIQDAAVRLRICVRLARPPVSSDFLFVLLAEENTFGKADLDLPCPANEILGQLYMVRLDSSHLSLSIFTNLHHQRPSVSTRQRWSCELTKFARFIRGA